MASLDWKERAGRKNGSESYQFGDFTRSIFTSKRTWGEKVGRNSDGDEPSSSYQFGDLSRTVIAVARDAKKEFSPRILSLLHPDLCLDVREAEPGGRYRFSHHEVNETQSEQQRTGEQKLLFASFNDMIEQITDDEYLKMMADPTTKSSYPQSNLSQRIWVSFLNASYIVSKLACDEQILDQDDIACSEPFLFLGIPALTALECSLRSINKQGMVLVDGSCIPWSLSDCFDGEEEEKILFLKLKEMTLFLESQQDKTSDKDSQEVPLLSQETLTKLRLKVIHASGDAARCDTEEEEIIANKVCSIALSIATEVSQLTFFQKAFMLVLETLEKATATN